MNPALIRQSVKQLREQHGFVGAVEHCFAPWYLHQRYHVPLVSAFSQSSDGNYDFGIDAYHLEDSKLILVQTKFTDGIQLIRSGFKELQRVLPEVARSFEGIGTEAPIQNMVLVNLRAALNRLSQEHRAELSIELQVVHLCELDEIILVNKVREDMLKLSEAAQIEVPNHRCHIVQVGPAGLDGGIIVVPPEETVLRFQGTHAFSAGDDCRMITGIGQLATLVDLYRVRRDGLFSKNVRYFLNSKKNTDKGPAGKMRSTLKEMCIEEKVVPERFAAFHNGITIFARRAVVDGDSVRLRDPFVLNGCQTIKNAFMFRHEKSVKDRINPALWERVLVPVRILESPNDELVRSVTVNNNRQNSMSPAALRSNDVVQIRLEQRFRERRIMYQRQEGAFDAVFGSSPELLDDEFENTQGRKVDIHELSRAIAAALGKLDWALHPNDLFEADKSYETCFDEKRTLNSIVFLTFLQNLHDVVGIVLKMDLNLVPKGNGPKPSRLLYHTICLLTRYLAREKDYAFVKEWGTKLYGRKPSFREATRKLLNSNKSRIRTELSSCFMALESKDAVALKDAFERCQKHLGLKDDRDPFVVFADLDGETPVLAGGEFEE